MTDWMYSGAIFRVSTENLHYIAEIISRFDLVAVQEVLTKIRRERRKKKSKNTICPHGALFKCPTIYRFGGTKN
jgi:hypothetical protein